MQYNNEHITSPYFLIEEAAFKKNLNILQTVQKEAGVSIILALKAFATWRMFPVVGQYLSGATASSLNEARLIYEEMGKKAHTYAVAYLPDDFEELLQYSSHLTFNSVHQYRKYQAQVKTFPEKISCGIRVNPEYSEVTTDLYNPAAKGSRLGVTEVAFADGLPEDIEGLHFHTLCESTSYELEKTLAVFEQKFGQWLPQLKWVNMGGGHLITRKDYNVAHLIEVLKNFKMRYPNLDIILEPGSAIAWQTGTLVSTILDIVENRGVQTAIVDVSFTAHMPDTLEMPYRPKITGATDAVVGKPTYHIGGVSCLAGDYMAEYSFDAPLKVGQQLIFEDMIHYTMVKTTMFNGVKHPSICLKKEDGTIELLRAFVYEDFRSRLG